MPTADPTPPPLPSSGSTDSGGSYFTKGPNDDVPVTTTVQAVEAILRQPRRILLQLQRGNSVTLTCCLVIVASLSALIYGLVAGSFSGGSQFWAAPIKIAGGLLLSAVICLPSLYIFSCLGGSKARLAEVAGVIGGLLALTSLLLLGFAPVAWVFSQSTDSVGVISSLHLIFWAISVYFGIRFVWRAFRHLEATRDINLHVWTVIFILVAFQMMTALRPIIGPATSFWPKEKKFFFAHWVETLNK